MTSFLITKKDKMSYEQKLSASPDATKRNKEYAVECFERFCLHKYNKSSNEVIEELIKIKKNQPDEYEDSLYGMLQEWIIWNKTRGIGNYTIITQFSNLRKYLFHRKIKTNDQDIKENLIFEKIIREERYPMAPEEFRRIIEGFARNPRLQALFLTLGSSGMRIGEALHLKKKDLDLTGRRIKVNIPPTTKTRTGRTTYLSYETGKILKPLLEGKNPEDQIFARNGSNTSDRSVRTSLNRCLDRMGCTERYQSNGYKKITSHSFRAFFFTKAVRKHGENYAHRMTGHGGYLMQYDRMTEEEKMEKYMELEPELLIFDQTKNEMEIKKLKKENQMIEQLQEEMSQLRKNQAEQDEKIIKTLEGKGIIPF